ncbi:MAG: TIGR01440 family protein [Clostridia bacterium]|nr:TIGR01440 family protein [Clostridia bacterium]
MNYTDITRQASEAIRILLDSAKPRRGDICVIGCSTSEVRGRMIGSDSSADVAAALLDGILPPLEEAGVFLAAQGCEHINRALCVSRSCMEKYGLEQVCVEPWLHAGGAFVTEVFGTLQDAVMVEDLRSGAALGMDIGDTLIGMHLRPVAVPVHTAFRKIGEANIVMARTRPRYVGGPRAHYPDGSGA